MLGYTTEEMTGMNCAQFATDEDEEDDWKHFQDMLAGVNQSYQIEKRYTRKDGIRIWGRLNVSLLNSPGQPPLVLATVEDITEKKATTHELKRTHGELQQLASRLLQTQEEERQRIARELHDDIGQRLSLLMMELDVLSKEMPLERTAEQARIHNLLGQLDELISDVHAMSHQLHSSKLKHLGLSVALREVCRQLSSQHRVAINLAADQPPQTLSEQVSLCFYRVAQEALSNAVKHSHSSRIELKLTNGGPTLCMQISDFGVGFDPEIQSNGLGLAAMQERLRMVGGTLRVDSRPGGGTQLVAEAAIAWPSAPPKVA